MKIFNGIANKYRLVKRRCHLLFYGAEIHIEPLNDESHIQYCKFTSNGVRIILGKTDTKFKMRFENNHIINNQ